MISPRTIKTLEDAFSQSLRQTAALSANSNIQIRQGSLGAALPAEQRKLLALSISSYSFRIITLFEFRIDADTAAHFAKLFRQSDENISEHALADALSEFVNMICGTANRFIASDIRRTGMSTPFVLETTCRAHLQMVKPEQIRGLNVCIDDALHFDIVLGICLSKGTTLDFEVDLSVQEEASGGELELF
jgi:hypothetical protein